MQRSQIWHLKNRLILDPQKKCPNKIFVILAAFPTSSLSSNGILCKEFVGRLKEACILAQLYGPGERWGWTKTCFCETRAWKKCRKSSSVGEKRRTSTKRDSRWICRRVPSTSSTRPQRRIPVVTWSCWKRVEASQHETWRRISWSIAREKREII